MNTPAHLPGLPDDDIIVSTMGAQIALQLQVPRLHALSWTNAIWLEVDACVLQSHVPPSEAEPVEIQIVGVADFGDWAGSVLMLG